MAMTSTFTHLHVASSHSLRYGIATPSSLVAQAVAHGQRALALTDRDALYGAVTFVQACHDAGIAPILGVDLAMQESPDTASSRTPSRDVSTSGRVIVLARPGGWGALCRLVSLAHRDAHLHGGQRARPVLGADALRAAVRDADGRLVVMLGPWSALGAAVLRRRSQHADALWAPWRDMPAGSVVMEVVSHRARPDATHTPAGTPVLSTRSAVQVLRYAHEQQIPAVLTNAVRYARPDQAPATDVLDAIRRLAPLHTRHIERANAEGWLQPSDAMVALAHEITHAAGESSWAEHLLTTTRQLAASCQLDPVADLGLGQICVPELDVLLSAPPVPPAPGASPPPTAPEPADSRTSIPSAHQADVVLRERCWAAFAQYLPRLSAMRVSRGIPQPTPESARQRLSDELEIISDLGMAGYFLTVAEVVDLIRDMGVRVAARGSGAGSFVNHLLGISGVDPLRHGLLMERFLSPLRSGLPDIDIDVESARREEIYHRILERFGTERVACVSMRDTYRVRHAIRDVGAALGMNPGDIDTLAKAFPHIRARYARDALRDLPELRTSSIGRAAARGEYDRLLEFVEAIDGLPRHIALHPCGVLLGDSTLLDRTPVETSWNGMPMSQFDKDEVEAMGLLKLDVLGVRMQSAIAHALDEIARVEGVEVDIDAISLDDEPTFELIRSTRTLGCFQIESPGQRELIGKFAPETFDDLIIDISLFRPGPVKSDMVTPFLRARQGWSMPEYLHPDLRPALEETYGVVVFHEQVLRIVATMTGCTLARADEVRRALGTPEGQDQIRTWFYPAARERGYDLPTIERVWDVLRAFASFGFCKAHAAAFALPTYQSAWLKTHHTAAFLAGVLTHDPGMYPQRLVLDDARQFGISILGIDINASDDVYRVEVVDETGRHGIRIPLSQVKGIDETEVSRLIASQPYTDLSDVWQRGAPSRPTLESLILIGAFDALYGIGTHRSARHGARRDQVTRRDLLLQVADLDRWSRRPSQRRLRARHDHAHPDVQLSLEIDAPTAGPSGLPEMNAAEQVRAELDILGMDASRHVLSFYEPMLRDLPITRRSHIMTTRADQEVLIAGVKVATQTPPVRSGRRVIFLTLDDATGPMDATFFEDAQGPYAVTLFHSWLLLVRGHVRRTGPRGVSIRATGCWELSEIHQIWREQGAAAVLEHIDASPRPGRQHAVGAARAADPATTDSVTDDVAFGDDLLALHGGAASRSSRPVLVHASGMRQSVYADVRPAGTSPATPSRRLWHSSPGSSGR